MILDYINQLNISVSPWGNAIIKAVIFELVMVLIIPLIGTLVNGIVVRGIRSIVATLLGRKIEYAISNYFLCIGVIIHELSHAFFAILTGAEITEVALFKPDGDSLGHVNFRTRGPVVLCALQEGFSACAPVVMGIVICSLIYFKLLPLLTATWQGILVLYLVVSIVFHMNMSKPDLKCYFKGIGVLALIALPFCFAYFAFFS